MKRLEERARLIRAVRAFFESRGFVEVQTPLMVPSPGLDLHLDAFAVQGEGPRYLITSPEYQMKRLLAEGMRKIFQIVPCFRRKELGSRHNPEFTMLEWYRANAGAEDVMKDTEQLVAAVTGITPPIPRLGVCEAFERYAGWTRERTLSAHEDDYFRTYVEKVEPSLPDPVFLVDYPATQASLARRKPGDPALAERFELYVRGIELCNGFGELTDPIEQRARLLADQEERAKRGLPVYPIDEKFLAALEKGIPPSGGNALGLDRLVMIATGATDIREVMAFADEEL